MASQHFIKIDQYLTASVKSRSAEVGLNQNTMPEAEEDAYNKSDPKNNSYKNESEYISSAFYELQCIEFISVIDSSLNVNRISEALSQWIALADVISLEIDHALCQILSSLIASEMKVTVLRQVAKAISVSEMELNSGIPTIRIPRSWLPMLERDLNLTMMLEIASDDQDEIEISAPKMRLKSRTRAYIEEVDALCDGIFPT